MLGPPIRPRCSFLTVSLYGMVSHHFHLGESTLILRDIGSDFEFLFHFSMKFL